MRKNNPNETKNGMWVECPACDRRWLVSKTVSVEVTCYCGTTFTTVPEKKKAIVKYGR